jgi:hypothetical protein
VDLSSQRLNGNLELESGSLVREQDSERNWEDINSVIDGSLDTRETVDRVIFLGFEGRDEEEKLRRIARAVMKK